MTSAGRTWFLGGPALGLLLAAALWPWPNAAPLRSAELGLVRGPRPARAARIVPAAAASVDLVCALVPPERIAALPEQALRYSALRDPDAAHFALPRFAAYEAEQILALRPDLVLVHAWQSADTTARLQENGVEVLLLGDPTTWEQIRDQLVALGRLLDGEAQARDLVETYDARVLALAAAASGLEGRTALCYSHGGAGGWTAGAGTTQHEMLRLAGLDNAAALAGRQGHVRLTLEELVALAPDMLVVGGEAHGQPSGGTLALLADTPVLASLAALAERRVVVLESWLFTTVSQHLVDAAEEVQRQALAFADPSSNGNNDQDPFR